MYLARKKIKGVTHYYIRESYQDGDTFQSRDLIDLGADPAEYIIYPGACARVFPAPRKTVAKRK